MKGLKPDWPAIFDYTGRSLVCFFILIFFITLFKFNMALYFSLKNFFFGNFLKINFGSFLVAKILSFSTFSISISIYFTAKILRHNRVNLAEANISRVYCYTLLVFTPLSVFHYSLMGIA